MALVAGAPIVKELLKAQIILELQALGWEIGSIPSEGTEAGNADIVPGQNQLDLATAIANSVVDQMIVLLTAYGEVTGVDAIGNTHVGTPTGGPFVPPVIT